MWKNEKLLDVEPELMNKIKGSISRGEINWIRGRLGIGLISFKTIMERGFISSLTLSILNKYYDIHTIKP